MTKSAILIAGALVLLFGLYFVGVRMPPTPEIVSETTTLPDFEPEKLLGLAMKSLDDADKKTADSILTGIKTSSPDTIGLRMFARFWNARSYFTLGGDYFKQAAEITNSQDDWSKAGASYLAGINTIDSSGKAYNASAAIVANEQALRSGDSSNSILVNLAVAHIDGKDQIMSGVQILLGVVKKEPKHRAANLILGRLAVLSGQYKKAVGRLSMLANGGMINPELFLLLGQAYEELGQKEKAIDALEKCKDIVDDLQVKEEIGKRIENIRNN